MIRGLRCTPNKVRVPEGRRTINHGSFIRRIGTSPAAASDLTSTTITRTAGSQTICHCHVALGEEGGYPPSQTFTAEDSDLNLFSSNNARDAENAREIAC
jgi:hypothetical protein